MKKICLLVALISMFSLNANASDMGMNMSEEFKPYIGADYVYSYTKPGGIADDLKRKYNSWSVNVGTDIAKYTSVELFFQQSWERKTHTDTGTIKSDFYGMGLDVYGRMPLDCSDKLYALGSLGIANYNVKYKGDGYDIDKQRFGYRAGIGMGYNLTEHVSARLMGRYTYIGMKNLNNLMEVTAGLRYTF